MRNIPEVGDVITLKAFSFNNKEGVTGLTDWDHNERYNKPAKFAVVQQWYDYECGYRGWAIPEQSDKDLMAYLQRNARKGQYNDNLEWKDGDCFIIYWSEFDVI